MRKVLLLSSLIGVAAISSACATAVETEDGGGGLGEGASGPTSTATSTSTSSPTSSQTSGQSTTSSSSTGASSSQSTGNPSSCGDEMVDAGEVCDDGNNVDGDGCSADCTSDESCGNSIIDTAAGEECDEGDTTPGDGCGPLCTIEECGNNIVDFGESCDDGNLIPGDGCDASCISESCVIAASLFPMSIPGSQYGLGQIAFADDCDILVVHGGPKNLVRIDALTGTQTVVASNISSGTYLIGVTYRPADGLAYVAGDSGQIYSVSSGGVATLIYSHPVIVEALAIAPPGFGAYAGQILAVDLDGQLFALDPAGPTMTTIGSDGANLSSIVVAPNGAVYVANNSLNRISSVSSSGVFTVVANTPFSPEGLAVDMAQNRLFVADSNADQLYAVSLTNGTSTALGSYDFDDGYFITGMLYDGQTLLMGVGESSMTLTDLAP